MRCPWPRSRAQARRRKPVQSWTRQRAAQARSGPSRTRPNVSDEGEWCCQTGLNCRPLHYQWSALPLSYGSMPGSRESAQKACTGGRFLPQGPLWRKRAAGAEGRKKREKITPRRPLPAATEATPGRSGSRFPLPRAASAFSGRTTTPNSIILRDSSNLMRSIPPRWPVADRGGKRQRGLIKPSRPSSIPAPVHVVRSPVYSPGSRRAFERACDEGRSSKARPANQFAREGFAAGPAETGATRKSQAPEIAGARA
jgi:hypothetical protein